MQFKNQFIIQDKNGERYIIWGTIKSWQNTNPELFDNTIRVPVEEYTADEIVKIFRNIVADSKEEDFSNIAKIVLDSIRKVNKLSPAEEREVMLEFVKDFSKTHYVQLFEEE